jgi:hypothetical protein
MQTIRDGDDDRVKGFVVEEFAKRTVGWLRTQRMVLVCELLRAIP